MSCMKKTTVMQQKTDYNRMWFTFILMLSTKGVWLLVLTISVSKTYMWGFPGGAVVKNPPANAGDTGSSPGPGRSYMLRSN